MGLGPQLKSGVTPHSLSLPYRTWRLTPSLGWHPVPPCQHTVAHKCPIPHQRRSTCPVSPLAWRLGPDQYPASCPVPCSAVQCPAPRPVQCSARRPVPCSAVPGASFCAVQCPAPRPVPGAPSRAVQCPAPPSCARRSVPSSPVPGTCPVLCCTWYSIQSHATPGTPSHCT